MKGHHQPVVMVKSCCPLFSGSGQRSRTNWHSFQDSVFYFQVAQSFILSASAVCGSVLLRKTRRMSVDEKWLVFGRTNYLSPKCELVLWSTEAGISRKCHLKSGPSWKPHCKFDGFRSELFMHWRLKDLEIVFPVENCVAGGFSHFPEGYVIMKKVDWQEDARNVISMGNLELILEQTHIL